MSQKDQNRAFLVQCGRASPRPTHAQGARPKSAILKHRHNAQRCESVGVLPRAFQDCGGCCRGRVEEMITAWGPQPWSLPVRPPSLPGQELRALQKSWPQRGRSKEGPSSPGDSQITPRRTSCEAQVSKPQSAVILQRVSKWVFASKVKQRSWPWWLMPMCPALRRLRQGDCECEFETT